MASEDPDELALSSLAYVFSQSLFSGRHWTQHVTNAVSSKNLHSACGLLVLPICHTLPMNSLSTLQGLVQVPFILRNLPFPQSAFFPAFPSLEIDTVLSFSKHSPLLTQELSVESLCSPSRVCPCTQLDMQVPVQTLAGNQNTLYLLKSLSEEALTSGALARNCESN